MTVSPAARRSRQYTCATRRATSSRTSVATSFASGSSPSASRVSHGVRVWCASNAQRRALKARPQSKFRLGYIAAGPAGMVNSR